MAVHNQVDLIGVIVSEPELLPTRIGRPKLQFRLAVQRPPELPAKWETVGEHRVRRPDHITVVTFGHHAASLHRHLSRGSRVLVVGGLISRDITVRGDQRTVNEVVARRIEFLGRVVLGEEGGDASGDSSSA